MSTSVTISKCCTPTPWIKLPRGATSTTRAPKILSVQMW